MVNALVRTVILTAVIIGTAGLAACDGDDDGPVTTSVPMSSGVIPSADAPTPRTSFTVAEVIDAAIGATEPVIVTGSLLVDPDGVVRLCSGLAESYPPQCAPPSLVVRDVDLAEFELTEAQGVRWSDEGIAVLGRVVDSSIVVDEIVS